jgi:hypothetical protein
MSAAKSRREIAGRLGLGVAAFVTSIVAPMPAQAASCRTLGQSCVPVLNQCCAGLECVGPNPFTSTCQAA